MKYVNIPQASTLTLGLRLNFFKAAKMNSTMHFHVLTHSQCINCHKFKKKKKKYICKNELSPIMKGKTIRFHVFVFRTKAWIRTNSQRLELQIIFISKLWGKKLWICFILCLIITTTAIYALHFNAHGSLCFFDILANLRHIRSPNISKSQTSQTNSAFKS